MPLHDVSSNPVAGAIKVIEQQTRATDGTFVFTNIPATTSYPWLKIMVFGRVTDTTDFQARIRFNNDTANSYRWQQFNGRGLGTSGWLANVTATTDTANEQSIMDITILNVTSSQCFVWQCLGGGRAALDSYSEFCTGYHDTSLGPLTNIEIAAGSAFDKLWVTGSSAIMYAMGVA